MARRFVTEADRRLTRRNVFFGVSLAVLLLILAGLALVLISYLRATSIPPPPPEARLADSAAASAGEPPPISLDAQLEQVEKAAREGRQQAFVISLRPVDLQTTLAHRLRDQRVENLRVYFGEGTVVAQGKALVGDRRLYVTLRVRPRVEYGQLHLDIVEGQLGTLHMPGRIKTLLQQQLDHATLDSPPEQTGVWLTGIEVSPYGMAVRGETRARQQ